MASSRPLMAAGLAALLLVLVLGVDASMDRSIHLDQRDAEGAWATLASRGEVAERERHAYPGVPAMGAPVAQNDSITMRLRVENGYPTAFDEAYVVRVNGAEVARGTLSAPSGSSGVSEFQVPVSRISAGGFRDPMRPEASQVHYGEVLVEVGHATLIGSVQVEVRP